MKYATILMLFRESPLVVSDEFSIPTDDNCSVFFDSDTRRHRSRFRALERAYRFNREHVAEVRPNAWIVAIELEAFAGESVSHFRTLGEQGSIEVSRFADFRYLYPTEAEWAILREPPYSRRGEVQAAACVDRVAQARPETADCLQESLEAFQRRLYRSAAVMLRMAAESIAGDLVGAFLRSLPPEDRLQVEREIRRCETTALRFRVFERRCSVDHLPLESLDLKQAASEAYKTLRRLGNRACHPSDDRIDRSDVEACYAALVRFSDGAEQLEKRFVGVAAATTVCLPR